MKRPPQFRRQLQEITPIGRQRVGRKPALQPEFVQVAIDFGALGVRQVGREGAKVDAPRGVVCG
jgi:hypothetical protein